MRIGHNIMLQYWKLLRIHQYHTSLQGTLTKTRAEGFKDPHHRLLNQACWRGRETTVTHFSSKVHMHGCKPEMKIQPRPMLCQVSVHRGI